MLGFYPLGGAPLADDGASGVVTLVALTLSNNNIAENTAADTVVGIVGDRQAGSTLSLDDNPGFYFYLFQGGGTPELRRSATALDYETIGVNKYVDIIISETLAGATNSPRSTTLRVNVIDVVEVFRRMQSRSAFFLF